MVTALYAQLAVTGALSLLLAVVIGIQKQRGGCESQSPSLGAGHEESPGCRFWSWSRSDTISSASPAPPQRVATNSPVTAPRPFQHGQHLP